MPDGFGFPLTAAVWQPLAQKPDLSTQSRVARALEVVGRLASGSTIDRAQAELDAINSRQAKQSPGTGAGMQATVQPYANRHLGWQVKVIVSALMGAVALVLLIGCANVANLLLARAAQRSREISVRVSLGATRWRIVRQLLFESLLLAAISGVAGYGLSLVGVSLLRSVLTANNPPFWLRISVDLRTFGFLAALCLGTAVLFGLAPAIYMSRTRAHDALRQAPRNATRGPGARRWTDALVIAEIALTAILLAGAAFMMHSFFQMYRAHGNINTAGLITMRVDLPPTYKTPTQRAAFAQQLEARLHELPAIETGAVVSTIPFEFPFYRSLTLESGAPAAGDRRPRVSVVAVSDGFFQTLNVHLYGGRDFGPLDGLAGHEHAIVNQRFADLYFPERDPIGHRLRLTDASAGDAAVMPWVTVIGVSPTIRSDVTTPGEPAIYLPYRAEPVSHFALLVRTSQPADTVVNDLREVARGIDPDLPLFDPRTLDAWLAFLRWPERVFGTMFTIFACIGLITAAVGLYAVTAYSVRQRKHEIGIRMALGARAPQVWWLVLQRVSAQLAIGLTAGIAGAFVVGRLPGIGSEAPWIPASVALMVICVAGVASFLPALRVTGSSLSTALRHD
jgi:predicted permease